MNVALVSSHGIPEALTADRPLVDALTARGARVSQPAWDDPEVAWDGFDVAVVRTTWDYTDRRERFVAWAAEVGGVTELWNRPDVLRWNTHKSYLIELEERGAPVVPTAWLAAGDQIDLAALLTGRGWSRAVVKPAVDAGSHRLLRVELSDGDAGQRHLDAVLASGDVMIQPYMPAIESSGETSVVVIDGSVSHVVRKVPAAGDFRVQVGWGGRYAAYDPPKDWLDLAVWIVESTGHEFLFARVDLVADDAGSPQLAELEATEPDLYLTTVPEAADRLADAIVARIP